MAEAFIGLGSNVGDRLSHLAHALHGIARLEDTELLDVSNVVESQPWGVTDQPLFANAVARIITRVRADHLLELLQEIERWIGREKSERYGPRAIDLDILLVDDEEWQTPTLIVPHPRLAEREFVVRPLLEIAPDVRLPDGSRLDPARATEGRIVRVLGPVPGFENITPVAVPGGGLDPRDWEEVESAVSSRGDLARGSLLLFDAAILEQEGIPIGWDPLPPGEDDNPWMLPRRHRLLVPTGLAGRARDILADVHAALPVDEFDDAEEGDDALEPDDDESFGDGDFE